LQRVTGVLLADIEGGVWSQDSI